MSAPIQVQNSTLPVSEIHSNTAQTLIHVTEDKLHLALIRYKNALEARSKWQTPGALLITLIIVFATSEFKDALMVPKASWQAFFMMATVLVFGWLVIDLYRAVRVRSQKIEDLVSAIKNIK